MIWNHTIERPHIRQLILIVVNDKLLSDVFVYHEDIACNRELTISWGEVQAWTAFKDISWPEWLSPQMATRESEGEESIKFAEKYRAGRADLFGTVVDPDDVNLGSA